MAQMDEDARARARQRLAARQRGSAEGTPRVSQDAQHYRHPNSSAPRQQNYHTTPDPRQSQRRPTPAAPSSSERYATSAAHYPERGDYCAAQQPGRGDYRVPQQPEGAGYRAPQQPGRGDYRMPTSQMPERPIYVGNRKTPHRESDVSGRGSNIRKYLPFILVVAIILVLLFGLGSCISSCVSSNNQTKTQDETLQVQDTAAPATPADYADIDRDKLLELIGDETLTNQLIARAETDEKSAWIAAHCTDYESLGSTQQCKLLKLAAKEASAVDFVRYYLDEVPASGCDATLTAPTDGSVIHLYQWDSRWAWNSYSRTVIGTAGCGPTAMAMVYEAMTGKADLTPYDMAQLAINNDYVHSGTDLGFYSFAAEKYGFSCSQLSASSSALKSGLKNGNVFILNMGPGDFTSVGHFIVAVGLDSDGKLIVNDPYSEVNSNKTWDIDTVISQTKLMLKFSN